MMREAKTIEATIRQLEDESYGLSQRIAENPYYPDERQEEGFEDLINYNVYRAKILALDWVLGNTENILGML